MRHPPAVFVNLRKPLPVFCNHIARTQDIRHHAFFDPFRMIAQIKLARLRRIFSICAAQHIIRFARTQFFHHVIQRAAQGNVAGLGCGFLIPKILKKTLKPLRGFRALDAKRQRIIARDADFQIIFDNGKPDRQVCFERKIFCLAFRERVAPFQICRRDTAFKQNFQPDAFRLTFFVKLAPVALHVGRRARF